MRYLLILALVMAGCGSKNKGDEDAVTDSTTDMPDGTGDTTIPDIPEDTAGTDTPVDAVDVPTDAPADVVEDDGAVAPPVCDGSYGTTWYVRTDGGDDTQCTGLADAAYPGSGSGQPCAFSHPFFALAPSGTVRMAGGDRLIIADGEYMIGYEAPGDVGCASDFPYDCEMATIPSGLSADQPTCVLGAGWATGCATMPELWGTERVGTILDLTGSDDVHVECLEITDHEGCVEFHSGAVECNRMGYPFGDWSGVGLSATDSSDVVLRNLDIHGMAHSGIFAGRLSDWTLEHVKIVGNGWVGFDGDVSGDDGNSGTMMFRDVTIAWNGCGETYPGLAPVGCWGQSAGGYGDGLGTGSTGGDWVFEGCDISHNTSDGLDLLYHDQGGTVIVDSTRAEGNAGNQVKTRGETHIVNSVIVGNCGYFDGQAFTYNVDNCRAMGNALSLDFDDATQITLVNSTLYSEGDCILLVGSGCSGTVDLVTRNNVFIGDTDFLQPSDTTCFLYSECGSLAADHDYNIVDGTKHDSDCPWGSNDLCEDPGIVGPLTGDAFGLQLDTGSAALNNGLGVGTLGLIPGVDIDGITRPQGAGVDRGAWELVE